MQALTKDELRLVLTAAKAARERDWLLFLIAYWHGLRISEVLELTPDNVQDGYLTVSRKKGSNKTVHPLITSPDPLFSESEALIDSMRGRHSNQRIFPISKRQAERLFARYCQAAGVPQHKAHPHVLKHTIAMQTIEQAGIENVRQYLGHKSISSTGSYLKVTDAEAAARVQQALSGTDSL